MGAVRSKRPAAGPISETAWRVPILCLGGGFVLKLFVVLQLRDHPLLQPDVGLDTTAYAELARRVVAGDLALGPGLYFISPLYIYFLAAGLAVTDSFTAVRVLQVLLGTASVGFVFLSARDWFGERPAWIAAGVATLTGLFTFYESLILQASLDGVLTSAALLSVTRGLTTKKNIWWTAAGIVFGLALLNRPNMAFGFAAIAAALLVTQRVRPLALIVAGLALGVAPVAIRNVVVSNQWSVSSSHGGLNFYIGNREAATGFFHPVPGITPNIKGQAEDARRVAEKALGRPQSDAETSSYFFGLAWTWIRQHPVDAASLFARKLGYTFSSHHVALPHSYPYYAYDAGTMLRFYAVGPWLLIPLGLVGLVFLAPPAPRRRDYLIWAAFVPGYALGVAAFFVAERYRLPLLVPLCIGTGAAIDGAVRAVGSRRASTLAAPAIVFTALFVLSNWRLPLHDGRWEEGLRLAEHLVTIGRYDEAEQLISTLEANAPRRGVAAYGVGVQLVAAKQGARALPHLRRAFEAGMPQSGYDLAVALQQTGELAAAARVIHDIRPSSTDDAEVWLKIGRLAMQVKAPAEAERFFRQAVAMQPDQASARVQYGLNLLVLDRCDAAIPELAEATRLDPKDPDALAHLAYCEIKVGRTAEARTHAEAALALSPAHALAGQVLEASRRVR
jgi:4-amino-4-deoxy-L-arabinose transferase-like glycosyltransferase/Flp pilus assembly protein TadD